MSAHAAQLLREAADHMDKVGFNQDGFYYANQFDVNDPKPDSERPCCTIGALKAASTEHNRYSGENPWDDFAEVAQEVASELASSLGFPRHSRYAHDHIVAWNDHPSTTKEQALELLRTTADKIEKEIDQ